VLQIFDPPSVRRWAAVALTALGEAREEIDALNVFPVPDGDTGTNMYLTLESAVTAAAVLPADTPVDQLAGAFARGALMGARGNSGVIGAQLLRGWAEALTESGVLDAASAVEGFRRADEQAWAAVNEPLEGTILSVSRAAARAAAATLTGLNRPTGPDGSGPAGGEPPSLDAVLTSAAEAAHRALELTPTQLPVLARAGVVDAGGRGFVVMVDSLVELVLGASRSRPGRRDEHRSSRRAGWAAVPTRPPSLPAIDFSACSQVGESGLSAPLGSPNGAGPGYEVMFLLRTDTDGEQAAVAALRPALAALGDSLVVIGGGGIWQVHVHVHDAGAALETAMEYGRPHRIRITHFSEQLDGHGGRAEAGSPPPLARSGLVACAAGPGLAELFQGAGAVVVAGGPGRRPSTGQLLDAVRRARAEHVAILPNDGDTLNVARAAAAAARADGVRVTVLPTRAQVQGLAAAAVHDPGKDFDDDVVAMSSAAGGARDGAVTVAVRDGLTSAGECRQGDALGVVDGDFAVVGAALQDVAVEVVERLLSGGGELVTLVVGAGGHEGLARAVAAHLRARHRRVEVSVLDGGQPRYPLLIGVE
jgi:DAK2 domain fusion protein YloV